jgi:hypothetical protein
MDGDFFIVSKIITLEVHTLASRLKQFTTVEKITIRCIGLRIALLLNIKILLQDA